MSNKPSRLSPLDMWNSIKSQRDMLLDMLEDFKTQQLPESRWLAELRIAERTLNSTYNFLIRVVFDKNLDLFRDEITRKEKADFLRDRDNIADQISTLIESNPDYLKRYNQYCDNLKELRSLGAML